MKHEEIALAILSVDSALSEDSDVVDKDMALAQAHGAILDLLKCIHEEDQMLIDDLLMDMARGRYSDAD